VRGDVFSGVNIGQMNAEQAVCVAKPGPEQATAVNPTRPLGTLPVADCVALLRQVTHCLCFNGLRKSVIDRAVVSFSSAVLFLEATLCGV
jgi:hypothetical protein